MAAGNELLRWAEYSLPCLLHEETIPFSYALHAQFGCVVLFSGWLPKGC